MIKMLKIFALRAASTNGNDKMKVYIFRLSGTTVTGPSPILGKWLHAPPDPSPRGDIFLGVLCPGFSVLSVVAPTQVLLSVVARPGLPERLKILRF